MSGPALLSVVRDDQVASITLNRPETGNTLDTTLLAEMLRMIACFDETEGIRALILRGNGPDFCAGLAPSCPAEIGADQAGLPSLVDQALNRLDKLDMPTVVLTHGKATGIGAAIVAACDVAIADSSARFSLHWSDAEPMPPSALRLIAIAIGTRATRRYLVTDEPMSATEAHRLGLIHDLVPPHMIDAAASHVLDRIRWRPPAIQAASKAHLRRLADPAAIAVTPKTD